MQKGLKGGVSLMNRGKWRGFLAKMPVLFLPRAGKQGREAGARRSSRARGLGARRQPGVGGKGGGRRGRSIPPADLEDGGA